MCPTSTACWPVLLVTLQTCPCHWLCRLISICGRLTNTVQLFLTRLTVNAVCRCQCGVPQKCRKSRNKHAELQSKICNQHAICTTNKIMNYLKLFHACLTRVTVQTAAVHVVLPTAVPGVLSLCPSLPAPLSSRCEGDCQFRCHSPAIFLPIATYMLPLSFYHSQSYSWPQFLHVGMFQSASTGHPVDDLRLRSHLEDKWIMEQL